MVTWGHDNHKLFIATNHLLHTICIQRDIPSLQQLCQGTISSSLKERDACFDLVLPTRLKFAVAERFNSLIKVHSWHVHVVSITGHKGFRDNRNYSCTDHNLHYCRIKHYITWCVLY